MQDVFVGRQPIYGRNLEVYAYELLYRGGDVDHADFEDADRATSQVLLNTFTEFGIERVVGDHLAFVNLTRGFVIGEYPLPLPPERVILEVLEDIQPDPEVLLGLHRLKRAGFRIALDDFVYASDLKPLVKLADIIKLDILGLEDAEIERRAAELRPFGVQLLAEKIETREQFELCHATGFEFFQGYFLARPNVVQGASIPASRVSLVRLLAALCDPECELETVSEIVEQDVTLSYKLLRHINTECGGLPRRIESIKETVLYLGVRAVKNLASLFLISSVDDTPHELIVTSMLRAKMCELLAAHSGVLATAPYFTVGLFSTLDAVLGASMSKVVSRLPLTLEVRAALLEHQGPLGEALAATLAYERGDWEGVSCFGLAKGTIKEAYLDAVAWVQVVDKELAKVAA
ncbi:MAG: HDOD domain-containing protein [Planctomycetota bacterium]